MIEWPTVKDRLDALTTTELRNELSRLRLHVKEEGGQAWKAGIRREVRLAAKLLGQREADGQEESTAAIRARYRARREAEEAARQKSREDRKQAAVDAYTRALRDYWNHGEGTLGEDGKRTNESGFWVPDPQELKDATQKLYGMGRHPEYFRKKEWQKYLEGTVQ